MELVTGKVSYVGVPGISCAWYKTFFYRENLPVFGVVSAPAFPTRFLQYFTIFLLSFLKSFLAFGGLPLRILRYLKDCSSVFFTYRHRRYKGGLILALEIIQLLLVLRVQYLYFSGPGARILIFTFRTRILDPGSKNSIKRVGGKIFLFFPFR